jgi:hypothetical protein
MHNTLEYVCLFGSQRLCEFKAVDVHATDMEANHSTRHEITIQTPGGKRTQNYSQRSPTQRLTSNYFGFGRRKGDWFSVFHQDGPISVCFHQLSAQRPQLGDEWVIGCRLWHLSDRHRVILNPCLRLLSLLLMTQLRHCLNIWTFHSRKYIIYGVNDLSLWPCSKIVCKYVKTY